MATWMCINFGSSNGLGPFGANPLPETQLAYLLNPWKQIEENHRNTLEDNLNESTNNFFSENVSEKYHLLNGSHLANPALILLMREDNNGYPML